MFFVVVAANAESGRPLLKESHSAPAHHQQTKFIQMKNAGYQDAVFNSVLCVKNSFSGFLRSYMNIVDHIGTNLLVETVHLFLALQTQIITQKQY